MQEYFASKLLSTGAGSTGILHSGSDGGGGVCGDDGEGVCGDGGEVGGGGESVGGDEGACGDGGEDGDGVCSAEREVTTDDSGMDPIHRIRKRKKHKHSKK